MANHFALHVKRSTGMIDDFKTLDRIRTVELYNGSANYGATGGTKYDYKDLPNRESQLRKGKR